MIVRIDVQYWALFAEMPFLQSHKESFKDFGIQPLAIPDAYGSKYFYIRM